jgi:hypothetical protein
MRANALTIFDCDMLKQMNMAAVDCALSARFYPIKTGNMTDLVKDGLAARDLKKLRPASALGAVSSAKNDDFQWRSICHTIVPELLHGAHTKRMLTAKEGLPSIADQVLTTSLASITSLHAAGLGPPKSNSSLGRGVKITATHTDKSCGLETQAREVDSIATPVTSAPKSKLVAASKAVGMITCTFTCGYGKPCYRENVQIQGILTTIIEKRASHPLQKVTTETAEVF